MKKLVSIISAICLSSAVHAQTINNLGSATTPLAGTELVPMFQGANPAKQASTQSIANLAVTSIATGCQATGGTITSTGTISTAETVNPQTGAGYTVNATDCGKLITLSNAGAQTLSIPQAGTTGFLSGYFTEVCNIGVGTWTLTPTTSSLTGPQSLVTSQCTKLVSDGTNWQESEYLLSASALTAGQLRQANGGQAYSPMYVAGNFYSLQQFGSAGNVQSSGYTFFAPIYISQPTTWEGVAFTISIGYSGTGAGYAVALYASGTGLSTHTAVNRPDGAPLASSSFNTGTGTGNTTLAFTSNYSVTSPGWYWLAFEFGDATQKLFSSNNSNPSPGLYLGGTISQIEGPIFGLSVAAVGGTLPTLTSSTTFTVVGSSGNGLFLAGEVASVP